MGVNKVILLGNLGKDPELKHTPSGTAVCTFSLATGEKYKDSAGIQHEKTEWHNIVAWGKTAELANQYLKKGRTVFIEGKIGTRSWDDQNGIKRYKTEITALSMQFVGGSRDSGKPADNNEPLPEEGPNFGEENLPF